MVNLRNIGSTNKAIVERRESYGCIRYYPANTTAEFFVQMVEQKTFTERDLQLLAKAGVDVEIVNLPK